MSRPVPNPGILDIAPYTPGKSPVPEPGRKAFKLSANETPFGPSPKAIDAYRNAAAPETDFTADVDAILKLVTPRTRLVWLANPNNPTGTYLPFDEVKRLRAGLPPHVLLVQDAAYSDYVSRNDYEMGIELVATTENTVMTHTFSKIHGLAALRVGWMFGPAP